MQVRAAVLEAEHSDFVVQDLELDPPKDNEVLIDLKACGICHSDDHARTGDVPVTEDVGGGGFPCLLGHEGAGVVEAVGPGVTVVKPGDHVATSFIPSCGYCKWCATGRMWLCDNGRLLYSGTQMDGTHRFHTQDGTAVTQLGMLGEFSTKTVVPEMSIVKIPKHIPFEHACLLSCGVTTGWGSAAERAGIKPGDTVVVWGCGGVGSSAIQGAALAGAKRIFAVDPNDLKLEYAQSFGATDVINNDGKSMEEVLEPIHAVTNGQGAEVTIMTPGVVTGAMIGEAYQTICKGGTLVITGAASWKDKDVQVPILDFAMSNKTIKGTLYGSLNPRQAIPHLIGLYETGKLKLAEMVTAQYDIDDANQAFDDMLAGRNIRGVFMYE
ncbi:MAG: NDMA-dependent alcohol dehydrogenase [Acidimicrobiales bacterium]